MMRAILHAVAGASLSTVLVAPALHAQTATINDIKGKIFDAKMAQQTFAGGLKHCAELDGTNFYFQPRDRVLGLDEFHRSLDSLALQGVFNPETKRPWNKADADARWLQVQKQAATDQANCALVARLPELQRTLEDLERRAGAASGAAQPDGK